MIRHGQKGYFVGGKVVGQARREIKMFWSSRERKLALDGQPVKKLGITSAHCARFVFARRTYSSSKARAARGDGFSTCCSRKRSRATSPCSSVTCTPSARAMPCSSSMRLTRRCLIVFRGTREAGHEIIRHRRELIPKLSPLARLAYRRISHDAEELRMAYEPSVKNDFAVELAQVRDRERRFRATFARPASR